MKKNTGKILDIITSKEDHMRLHKTIQNKTRRKILEFLMEKERTIEELFKLTGLTQKELDYHIKMLKYGLCIEEFERENKIYYRPTREGEIVIELTKK
ncbi:MAG: winged helix-turn-helix domain-containing protein [Candidatus Hydrothermarchaeota archaeon]